MQLYLLGHKASALFSAKRRRKIWAGQDRGTATGRCSPTYTVPDGSSFTGTTARSQGLGASDPSHPPTADSGKSRPDELN